MKLQKVYAIMIALCIIPLFNACSSDDDGKEVLSSKNDLFDFKIPGLETRIEGTTIYVEVPSTAIEFKYTPTFSVSDKAFSHPESGMEMDLEDLEIEVYAEDLSLKKYKVVINQKDGLHTVGIKPIYNFSENVVTGEYRGIIDNESKIITFRIPFSKFSDVFYSHVIRTTIKGDFAFTTIPLPDVTIDETLSEYKFINMDAGTSENYTVQLIDDENAVPTLYD